MKEQTNKQGNKGKADYTNQGSKNLPQYGKKGKKPRRVYEPSTISLDEIRTNDISYWNKTSGFDNVTKFNWDLILGRPRDPGMLFYEDPNDPRPTFSSQLNPAAIMAIDVVIGCGWAQSIEDGVNRGLAKIMASIRAALSTSNIGFETADLGIFLTSTSSIAAFIGYAKRVLESYTVWKDKNYMYPRALIRAQGPDYSDIRDNINVYAAKLNAMIDQYNGMSILDTFDIFDRQYSMCHNVFADEDHEYGQLYIFRPNNYYLYSDTSIPSKAEYVSFDPLTSSFTDILTIIQSMIDAWYSSSDLYQINGTLLRAFKDAPRQHIPYYDMLDTISPTVDRSFLMQIMNCTIVENLIDYGGALDITQDGNTQNYVIWKPQIAFDNSWSFATVPAPYQILRLFEDDIDKEDCMEMTRLLNFADPTDGYLTSCGSELVVGVTCYTYNTVTNSLTGLQFTSNSITIDVDPGAIHLTAINMVNKVGAISPFRYIPAFHLIGYDGLNNPYCAYHGLVGDVYNWMLYPREDWLTLQFVAYQSLWTPKNL